LSDQLYRQSKIDEENRRLKKKSKADGASSKKGKKSSTKLDTTTKTTADDNDEDLYPTIKVTRGGELPEGVHESANDDDDCEPTSKNKKYDPHRALNIDLDDRTIQQMPSPPVKIQPIVAKPVEPVVAPSMEKLKKSKKKKSTDDDNKSVPIKVKQKRERGDYKELLSPVDNEDKRGMSPSMSTTTMASVPVSTIATTNSILDDKPKKKKSKAKKTDKEHSTATSLLFDIMSDDMTSMTSSNTAYTEENIYKLAAQSDHLTIVNCLSNIVSCPCSLCISRNILFFQ
jgi:hypothetical protein